MIQQRICANINTAISSTPKPLLRDTTESVQQLQANITCQEGDLIQHGNNCTPACLPGFTAPLPHASGGMGARSAQGSL